MEQLSIFNISQNAQQLKQEMYGQAGGSDLFDIRVDLGKTTSFVIRVLPYVKDVKQTKVKKFYYTVPNGENFIIYDSMTTFNQPQLGQYHFCPISDIWAKLDRNPDPNVKKLAGQLRRQTRIVAYVQVIACPDKPELNGKIMPMSIPYELEKTMRALADPDDAQKALGAKDITAFDLYEGVNFTCSIKGHKPFANGPVMRQWTVKESGVCEMNLPLGPDGAMTPVSQLSQEAVLEYFNENQSIDIVDRYGFKPANMDANIAAYNWLRHVCGFVPGIAEAIDTNFKEVVQFLRSQEVGAMHHQQNEPTVTEQANYGTPQQTAGNPMAQAAPQQTAGNPMAQAAPQQTAGDPTAQAAPQQTAGEPMAQATEATNQPQANVDVANTPQANVDVANTPQATEATNATANAGVVIP